MLPFGITILATVPQGLEILEGLMNYPVLMEASCKTYTSNYSKLLAKLSLYLLQAAYKFSHLFTGNFLQNFTFLLTPSFCKLSLLPAESFLQIFPFYLWIAPCRIFPPTYWELLTEPPGVTSFLHFMAFTCPTLAVSIARADFPTTLWDTGNTRSSTITRIACPIWLALALAAYTSAMVRTRTQQTIGILTGEVVTFTVLTRVHLENRQPK